jgi:hypothetical protein
MATSSMIQYLTAANDKVAASNRRVTEQFIADGAIAIGDFVCFELTETGTDRVVQVVRADAGAVPTQQAIGVCIAHDGTGTNAADGDEVTVVIKGYAEGANVGATTAQGNLLVAGTAGRGEPYDADATDANYLPVAQALEDDTANVADVWVIGLFS